jgi:hypothetical protein
MVETVFDLVLRALVETPSELEDFLEDFKEDFAGMVEVDIIDLPTLDLIDYFTSLSQKLSYMTQILSLATTLLHHGQMPHFQTNLLPILFRCLKTGHQTLTSLATHFLCDLSTLEPVSQFVTTLMLHNFFPQMTTLLDNLTELFSQCGLTQNEQPV